MIPDGSVRNIVNREEGIPQDFHTSSVTSSAMCEFCEKHYAQILSFMAEKGHNEKLKDDRKKEEGEVGDPRHKHPRGLEGCSPAWELKGKNNEGKTLRNSYEDDVPPNSRNDMPHRKKFPQLVSEPCGSRSRMLQGCFASRVLGGKKVHASVLSYGDFCRGDDPYARPELDELTDLMNLLAHLRLSDAPDSWSCLIDSSRVFTVRGMKHHIFKSSNSLVLNPIRWNKLLPAKINICSWRITNRRLPTLINLDKRGIDLNSVRCQIYDKDLETEDHLFVFCDLAIDTWKKVLNWWNLDFMCPSSLTDLLCLADNVQIQAPLIKYFDVVMHTTIWLLWRFRNEFYFALKRSCKDLIFSDVVLYSFMWISSREKNASLNWIEWLNNQCNALSSPLGWECGTGCDTDYYYCSKHRLCYDDYCSFRSGPTSYAKLVTSEPSRKSVNFRSFIASGGNEADMAILLEYIRAISKRFANTTYGFFSRKWVAYPVVANYVKNTWSKYGLVKSMLCSSNGLFFFQFSSKDGSNAMLENGPWYIRNNSFILKKWNLDVILQKEYVGNVLVWVKFYGVSMTTFSEDGFGIIATTLGASLMLDSYTSDMCMQSWGRSSYDRAMIELRADEELKNTIVVAIPILVGEGFSMCTIHVEYKWKSPRCSSCKFSGHVLNECSKKIILDVVKNFNNPRQATRGVPIGLKCQHKVGEFIGCHNLIENDADLGKLMLVDDDGKPLTKVVSMANTDSDSEVEDVFDE
ncbi:putative reverse transcriptase domain-containing protein [Tanacetum coccineum]